MLVVAAAVTALALLPQDAGPDLLLGPTLRVTTAQYRDWLVARDGAARLEEMAWERVLEQAAAAVPAADVPDDLRVALTAPDTVVITRRFGSLAAAAPARLAFVAELAAAGRTEEDWLRSEAGIVVRDARIALLVRAARVATDAALQVAFEDRYGQGGVRTTALQRVVAFPDVRARLEAARRGPPLTDATVAKVARDEAAKLAADARAAGGLEALGAQPVPDGFAGFAGPELEAALHDLPVGAISDPIASRFGFHVVEIQDRVTTRFEDVVGELRAAWHRAPPSLAEQSALRARLYAAYGVETALRARATR